MLSLAHLTAAFMITLMLLPSTFAAEIVGHRGASANAPENTLASFKLGYQENADADELDIHLTKDGKIVVVHDYDTKRVGGVDKKVVEQTFDEIRAINVGAFGKWRGRVSTRRCRRLTRFGADSAGKKLLIEIKVHEEILPALAESLKRAAVKPEQTVIITFYLEVAKAAKKKFPIARSTGCTVTRRTRRRQISRSRRGDRQGDERRRGRRGPRAQVPARCRRHKKDQSRRPRVPRLDPGRRRQRPRVDQGRYRQHHTNRPGDLRRELQSSPKVII